jgi:uncharacterized protein (TIGR02145 family)
MPESDSSAVIPAPVPGSASADFFRDFRDGQVYKMVTIGDQVWMAKNLNYEMAGSYCYSNNASNCMRYGRLYTWESARTIAPPGWHLATRKDFNELGLFCKGLGQGKVGTMLKSAGPEWNDHGIFGPGTPGTDAVGFSAKPTGVRTSSGVFSYMGSFAYFWCADEENMTSAYYRHLSYFTGAYQECSSKKECAFSVRLVKNQ